MSRRHPTPLALVAALWLAAAGSPPTARAAVTTTTSPVYQLTNTTDQSIQQVVANVVPPGTIVPADAQTPPLTVQNGSSGFDPTQLKVLLGAATSQSGSPLQALALDFGSKGLGPHGVLDFTLSLDPKFQGNLQLQPVTPASGVTIAQLPPSGSQSSDDTGKTSGTGPGSSPTTNTPEPATLVLWSALAGFGLVRARRRLRPPAIA
ncbi:MAG TPA: hypothetical protein VG406_19050 [Isosphaeraceae bacterium]|nr:hypothetical protein [Isosphaeraceae bacterium]